MSVTSIADPSNAVVRDLYGIPAAGDFDPDFNEASGIVKLTQQQALLYVTTLALPEERDAGKEFPRLGKYQRPVDRDRVAHYQSRIDAGEMVLISDPIEITIGPDFVPLVADNGQSRLYARSRSDNPEPTAFRFVWVMVPDAEAFLAAPTLRALNTDQIKPKNFGHTLKALGVGDYTHEAAVARLIYKMLGAAAPGQGAIAAPGRRFGIGHDEMYLFYNSLDRDIWARAMAYANGPFSTPSFHLSKSGVAAFYYLAYTHFEADAIDGFFDALKAQKWPTRRERGGFTTHAAELLGRMGMLWADPKVRPGNNVKQINYMIFALHKWLRGQEGQQLGYRPASHGPVPLIPDDIDSLGVDLKVQPDRPVLVAA